MEKHYVCDECGSQSKSPGTCLNELCIKQGLPLKECHCKDGKHARLLGLASVAADEDSEEDKASDRERHSEIVLDLDSDENK